MSLYLRIAARRFGEHVALLGGSATGPQLEALWVNTLSEFFTQDGVTPGSITHFSSLTPAQKKKYFEESQYAFDEFVSLCKETLNAHSH